MKNYNITIGTEKQVSYMNSLLNDLVVHPQKIVNRVEEKGLDSFNERQIASYHKNKKLVDGVASISEFNAVTGIDAIKKYNGGDITVEELLTGISK